MVIRSDASLLSVASQWHRLLHLNPIADFSYRFLHPDIRKLLDQFRHDGEVLAADVYNGAIPTIPVMSQMLREDFWALRRPLQAGDQVRHRQYGVGTVRALIALPTGEDGAQVSFRNARLKRVPLESLQRVLCPAPQAGD